MTLSLFFGYYITRFIFLSVCDDGDTMQHFFYFKNLENFSAICHRISMRADDQAYAFSMALHTGEDLEDIIANRDKVAALLGSDTNYSFVLADQTHGNHVAVIRDKKSRGWSERESAVAQSDALLTDQKGVMLGVLTADCVPILLYDPLQGVVAAIHAGWRGSAAKITAKCVATMRREFDTDPSDIVAGIAPSIGECCYEVGSDVAAHFTDYEGVLTVKGEKYMLNLPEVNRLQLIGAGVPDSQIELSGICTACNEDKFFSYRKTGGCSGRFITMIGLKDDYDRNEM